MTESIAKKSIIWVAAYMVEIDAECAFPVRDVEGVRKAIEKNQVKLVSEGDAQTMNDRVMAHEAGIKKYLEDKLEMRWKFLKSQGYA